MPRPSRRAFRLWDHFSGFTLRGVITKAVRSLFRLCSGSLARSRYRDRMEVSPEKILAEVIVDILRPRRFQYLHTLWRELCSACWRTEMSRRTGWLNHGIPLLCQGDENRVECQCGCSYSHARIVGIQRLLSIHPLATKFDLQLLCELIRPGLFGEADHTVAESGACISSNE